MASLNKIKSNTTYNGIKFVFLYKVDETVDKYYVINRSFVLTMTRTTMLGQYISSNWFNWKYDIKNDISFMIIGVDKDVSFIKLQHLLDINDFTSFKYTKSFTVSKDKLQTVYDSQKIRNTINCKSHDGKMLLSLTTRLTNNNDETNNLYISHPYFKTFLD